MFRGVSEDSIAEKHSVRSRANSTNLFLNKLQGTVTAVYLGACVAFGHKETKGDNLTTDHIEILIKDKYESLGRVN